MIDMGNTFNYDESAKNSYKSLTSTQKYNREMLYKALSAVGLVNYGYEWWHYSYGDKFWAYIKKKDSAIYSAVKM